MTIMTDCGLVGKRRRSPNGVQSNLGKTFVIYVLFVVSRPNSCVGRLNFAHSFLRPLPPDRPERLDVVRTLAAHAC